MKIFTTVYDVKRSMCCHIFFDNTLFYYHAIVLYRLSDVFIKLKILCICINVLIIQHSYVY